VRVFGELLGVKRDDIDKHAKKLKADFGRVKNLSRYV
jgi:hypothetical protein